jgi:hypothetical protein
MTLEASNPSSTNHPSAQGAVQSKSKSTPRCRHFTADGTRCRLPILDTRSHLCFRHASLSAAAAHPEHNDSEDLSADLLPELSEFSSGIDIRQFLGRLLTLVTKGRISPRRASVLAYITNQLLHSHRAITLESAKKDTQIIFDIPHPLHDRLRARPENPTYQDLRT